MNLSEVTKFITRIAACTFVPFQTSPVQEETDSQQPWDLHMLRSIWEELRILRCRVFWTMRSSVTDDHHHRAVRIHLLRHAEKVDAVIGDQICEIVLGEKKNTAQPIS